MSRIRFWARGAVPIGTAFLLSCAHAGAERVAAGGTVFEAPGVFTLGSPGPEWKLRRNRRVGDRMVLDYKRRGADVNLRVAVHALDDGSRKLPLPTMAEGMVLHYGRGRGLETEVRAIQRVDFGRHEGLVVHSVRRWKPNVERKLAQCFIRTRERLVIVSYIAPPALYETYAPDFARALEGFAVLLPPEAPVYGITLPEDLPQTTEPPSDTAGGSPLPRTTPAPPAAQPLSTPKP